MTDLLGGLFGGDDDGGVPKVEAQTPKKTAKALPQSSEQAKRNKRRRAGGTQDFAPPQLGLPGLLGE